MFLIRDSNFLVIKFLGLLVLIKQDMLLNKGFDLEMLVQGVRGQSGFFNLALRERNIQIRLCLKIVLKSLDVDILIIRTNFLKNNLGWPQQPPTE